MLLDLTSNHKHVSIVGMCKNAGKTTVLNHLISECYSNGLRIALCSVGRDGEKIDVVTKTDKPGIFVRDGTVFSTTKGLVVHCDIPKELLLSTGISTALGEVLVYRALDSGPIELSGPSINAQMPPLLDFFQMQGAEKILIDGAVSRKASSSPSVAGCTILCTGADLDPDMSKAIAETAHIASLLSTEALTDSRAVGVFSTQKGEEIIVLDGNYEHKVYEKSTRIPKSDAIKARYVYFPGALTDNVLISAFGRSFPPGPMTLVTDYSSKLMISHEMRTRLLARGASLRVLEPVTLACICINPLSTSGRHYDKEIFLQKMSEAVEVPVINVLTEKKHEQ